MHGYRRIGKVNIKPVIGTARLDKLTGQDLDRLYRHLSQRRLSPASVRRHHALIHAALARAVKWGMVPANVADRATPPKAERPDITAPGVDEVQRLIAAAEKTDPLLATAIAIGAVTGARRGELHARRWSDVDWQRRVLRIARSLTVIRQQVTEGPTKTHQVRQVAIGDLLGDLLVARRDQQDIYAQQMQARLCDDPYVLSRSADGSQPCLPDGLSQAYKRVARSIGLSGHLHGLRHFAATTAIAGGMDVPTVAGRLGRADPVWGAGGARMDRYAADRTVKRLAPRAGITKTISPHSLRHSFMTAQFYAGVPIRDVQ
jgi:integrase